MRAGAPPEGLGPAARARVWSRLRDAGRGTERGTERGWRPIVGLRWSVAAIVLLASAGVVAGVTARRWWPAASRAVTPVEAPARKIKPKARMTRVGLADEPRAEDALAAAEGAALPVPVAFPAPAAAGALDAPIADVAPRRRASSRAATATEPMAHAAQDVAPPRLVPPAVPAPALAPLAPSALAVEAPLLAEALTRLRQHQDAPGALAALDAYDARFPRGTLRREADGARVDALLVLGRDDDALTVLRRLTLQPRRRDQELRVIRGELAAPTSCAAAVADFDRVLSEASASTLAERALHGRATCLARLGDAAAATRDLREYLRRFPDGRFAAEARRVLDENSL
jgi:TolA-binding protein